MIKHEGPWLINAPAAPERDKTMGNEVVDLSPWCSTVRSKARGKWDVWQLRENGRRYCPLLVHFCSFWDIIKKHSPYYLSPQIPHN